MPPDFIFIEEKLFVRLGDTLMRKYKLSFVLIFFLGLQNGVVNASDTNIGKMMRVAATHAQCTFLARIAAESESRFKDKIMIHMSAFLKIGRKVIKIAKADDAQAKVLIKEGPLLTRWIYWGEGADFGLGMMYEKVNTETYDRKLKGAANQSLAADTTYQSENCDLLPLNF